MLNKLAPYILAILLLILGLSAGFFLGRRGLQSKEILNSNQNTQKQELKEQESLFTSQTATILGTITKKEDGVITVKNFNNQTSGTVSLSSRLLIADANKKSSATPSGNFSDIQLNKEALISLEKTGAQYQVVTIQYTHPTPSLPPIISKQAQ